MACHKGFFGSRCSTVWEAPSGPRPYTTTARSFPVRIGGRSVRVPTVSK